MKKKLCFITSSRADYGLLSGLICKVKKKKKIKLKILVTGSHLSKKHGYTIDEIIRDGFNINQKVTLNIKKENHVNNLISSAIKKFHLSLIKLKPDIVVLLGDRFEIFAASVVCFFLKIPIAHIHGGEVTEGAFDDTLRHSITKFSSLHFVSNIKYRKRVMQLGENPSTIYNVGSLGVENIKKNIFTSDENLEREYKFKFQKKNILVSLHSETNRKSLNYIRELMKALNEIKKREKDLLFIFTGSNLDPGANKISNAIKIFNKKNPTNSIYIESLGKKNYLSLLRKVDLIIGNSSSGIIEAPSLKTKTLNLGKRQHGRLMSKSIFSCEFNKKEIIKKFYFVLGLDVRNKKSFFSNCYEKNNTSAHILNILSKKLKKEVESKKFFDI